MTGAYIRVALINMGGFTCFTGIALWVPMAKWRCISLHTCKVNQHGQVEHKHCSNMVEAEDQKSGSRSLVN